LELGNPEREGDFDLLYRRNMQLVRQVDHLSTLREIGLAITESLELHEALPIIANVVQGALDVRRLTLYELTKDGKCLQPLVAKYGQDLIGRQRLAEDTLPAKDSRFGNALERQVVTLRSSGGRAEAVIPLVAKNEPLGLLVLEDPEDGEPFRSDDQVLFRQMGSQIAIAIHNAKLYALAVTDGLTGLFVRRYFDLRLDEEFAAARRYNRVFSVLLFDIDHFKKFNDTHGHQTGDLVLQQFARLLEENTRECDICCRYGGEEMTVILPETGLEEGAMLANKLCAVVRKNTFSGTSEQALAVTTSIGVAAYDNSRQGASGIVEAADQALYRAKELGRNRVELDGI
jgi:diguanylate cyclase (GGDEF)-like protein